MFRFDTEWAYKHLVIIVAVHKMDLRLWNKNSKRRYLEKVMGKNWLVHINLEQVI